MRFLADENLPRSITLYLQNKGFDVKDLHRTNLLEHPDEEIGRYASIENRIVLTFDKDFLIPQTIPPSFRANSKITCPFWIRHKGAQSK